MSWRRGERYYILLFAEMLFLMIVTGSSFMVPLPDLADWDMATGVEGTLRTGQGQVSAEHAAHCDLPLPSAARRPAA